MKRPDSTFPILASGFAGAFAGALGASIFVVLGVAASVALVWSACIEWGRRKPQD